MKIARKTYNVFNELSQINGGGASLSRTSLEFLCLTGKI
ncbi:hypothetical protein MTBPR1_160004 [Candidatus Terasakiella magnetica]|uniref:Uncharacterized protein n=1 Tax=Candidatus Terasakiella magnetica TaxID=1867952 RepID=A0A1C3RFE3_9PROT|nr:hypothetical protein MTBPR1_160004 [Candidatus Terasakiella magnetica]